MTAPSSSDNNSQHSALKCLAALARHHRIDVTAEQMIVGHSIQGSEVEPAYLVRLAKEIGLKAKLAKIDWDDLKEIGEGFPILAFLENGNSVVFSGFRVENGVEQVVVLDPKASAAGFLFVTREQLDNLWRGNAMFVSRHYELSDPNQPFSIRWFFPEILRQRKLFANIALAAIMLHVVGLMTPLFFQVVVDKVLVHNSGETLRVMVVGVTLAIIFEVMFGFLRNIILLNAANKIDIRLSMRTFNHLMRLPLHFFESSSSGVLSKHMHQAESIREFLTGSLFFALLDLVGLFIFLPMLLSYSAIMTGIVIGFAALISATILFIMPIFRQQLQALYRADGEKQSMLVETIHGMRTVKALAIEPTQKNFWNDRCAETISRQYEVGLTSHKANMIVEFLEKMSKVVIVWVGAEMVFAHRMTVGELIAIQMLADKVSSPLVRLVSLVNKFQETSLSVKMLGEVMNRPPEDQGEGRGSRPTLQGDIVFEDVTFYYPGAQGAALNRVSLSIKPGQFIGVVGRSGSGKSTFVRLLQGLYVPQYGYIKYDGNELRELDRHHLRRSVGIVVQESFLFRGTVRQNLAITKPLAEIDEIIAASRAAGAEEFIKRLPQGYDTWLEENASNLSGGQKQRLSIARSLLANPRILLLDEATSALDPESEAIIQENMDELRIGKTLIVVSHRLSTIAAADATIVFDRGQLVDMAPHAVLLERCEIYQALWAQQTKHMSV